MRLRTALLPLAAVAAITAQSAPALAYDPVQIRQGVVTRQDVASRNGSETDTVVEPDVAVSPKNRNIAIAAAHDSRFADGGAVGISVSWTHDGGQTWHHRTVPGITKATGGPYDRASDPVVTFGPGGTAYLSVLLIMAKTCPSAVAVLRSGDGGVTWSKPFYAHRSNSCAYSDDKNWIVSDRSPRSPHYGRLYQFWTPFLSDKKGNYIGSPQVVRWSDNRGTTWSATHYLTPRNHGTQNSQPMIRGNGSIVDTFYDSGVGQRAPDFVPGAQPERLSPQQRRMNAIRPSYVDASGSIYAETSTNGGRSWSPEVEVTNNGAGYAYGVRCCLFAADIDPITHRMFTVWEGGVGNTDPVYLSWSDDGFQWSSPVRVSQNDRNGVQRVNVDVVARRNEVMVGYGTRTSPQRSGGYVQQQLSTSHDGGRTFGSPQSIGPLSVLKYAAYAEGYFPGDYIGEALAPGRLYMVWARSSKPPAGSTSKYHQVIYGATLRT